RAIQNFPIAIMRIRRTIGTKAFLTVFLGIFDRHKISILSILYTNTIYKKMKGLKEFRLFAY
ncbi:MAG: hypothetical protein UW66_C0057G0007, partial [Candidatus Moranbacteria bacterium GW2011_GWF1_44_4]